MCDSTVMNYFELHEIEKEIKRGALKNTKIDTMVDRVCVRRLGCGLNRKIKTWKDNYKKTLNIEGRIIRVSTPLDQVAECDIPSPSTAQSNCISLPSTSQMKKDKEMQKTLLDLTADEIVELK